jgi:hypothetical protein
MMPTIGLGSIALPSCIFTDDFTLIGAVLNTRKDREAKSLIIMEYSQYLIYFTDVESQFQTMIFPK